MGRDSAPGESTDRQLCADVVRGGNEHAFRTLYRRHTPALYLFVLRVLGGAEADAQDVIQEVWIRAVRALPQFRWDASLRTWLTGIALNNAREVLRRNAKHEAAPPPAEPWVPPAPTVDRVDLERALGSLPEGYRTVLLLHDLEGFTHEQIGGHLCISQGTSKSQLFHARRAMRRMLDASEELG